MRRLSVALAIATAGILGCAALIAMLPWGDPCSFVTPPGECCCYIILSSLQENIRNGAFGIVCLVIGVVAGLLTRSNRIAVGALSPPLAFFLGHYAAHWVYHIGWPKYPVPWSAHLILLTVGLFAGMAALGVIGAILSRYVRLTSASSAA